MKNPNFKYYQIPSKSQLNPFLLEKEKCLRKRKTRLNCFFGKAFFSKERFLVVLGFRICLVVLVCIGMYWDLIHYMPPSLRERKRYLAFEVISEREVDKRELLEEIRSSIYSLYGDVGASESRIWLIEYDKKKDADTCTDMGVGILRCAHDKVEEVRAALACIHSVKEARVGVRVVGISGTIKGASRLISNTPLQHLYINR